MKIIVGKTDLDSGKRLDLYLSLKVHKHSRSQIKTIIESNKVLVNGVMCFKPGYKVQPEDVIDFPEIETEQTNFTKLPKSKFDLEIIFEDHDYLFINKPIGISVHPTSVHDRSTIVNKLLDLYDNLPQFDFLRPGIVHRLDKDTSGVMVISKNPKSLWWISQQFATRKVKKEYVSIAINQDLNFKYTKDTAFDFEGNIKRNSANRKQFYIDNENTDSGKFSKSEFKILDVVRYESSNLILTRIKPLTGRTHQIRVHQKTLGFPIIRDVIYLSNKQLSAVDKIITELEVKPRLYLHAHKLSFENYDGRVYSIEAKIPNDFIKLLENAKKRYTKT